MKLMRVGIALVASAFMACFTQAEGVAATSLPKATVTQCAPLTLTKADHDYMVWPSGDNTVDRPLQIVMNFKAQETLEEAKAGAYGKYKCDFYLTIEGLAGDSITADNCYLAGNYGSFGWIVIPTDGTVLEEGVSYPIVSAYDANLTYENICDYVKDFTAAIYVAPTILAANPDFKVSLALKMTDPNNEANVLTIGTPATYTVKDLLPLPTATVTELNNEDLTFALNFKADSATEAQLATYGNWYADFVLKVNKDVTFNANGGANGYLSGQYDAWSENWVNVPFEDVTLEANESLKIMAYAAEMMNQGGLKLTYNDVVSFVKDFDCGVFFEPAFLAANPDLNVTLELRMYNPANEDESYVIGKTYEFKVGEKPTVVIPETITPPEGIEGNTAVETTVVVLPTEVKTFEISLKTVETENAVTTKVVFTVEPKNEAGDKVSTPASAITFRLPVPAAWAGMVKVFHDGTLMGTYAIQESEGAKFVELSSDSFSEFALEQVANNIEVTDANGNVTYYAGFTGFSDLDLADCTIKLLNNVSDANLILNKGSTSKIVDTNVTLDLNGYTFSRTGSSSGAINLTNGAGLTIRDSSDAKTGKILVDTYAVWMMNGDFVLESGTIETTSTKNAAIYANAAEVAIKAGKIISAGNAITVGENFIESRGTSTIEISGGEIVAAGVGIKNGSYAQTETVVTVTGGTIDSEGDSISFTTGSAQVSGGTFSSDVSDYCVDGFEVKQNADGTYGVVVDPAYGKVAKIGDEYYATLSAAFAAVTDDNQTVTILKDVTEELTGASPRGNITTENDAKVTITLTNSDWVYCPYTFVLGANVTLKCPALFYYAGGTQINGTLIVDAYYQRYAGTKLTINEPGSMTVTGETFILRYTDGDANAGIYINGDNNDETIGLKLAVAYFYQGMISAKDANLQVGTYWQTNDTDNQGSANLVLDNSSLNVTVNEHNMKATGNSTVTLKNGSSVEVAGGYQGAAVKMDATSSFTKNGNPVFVAKIGETLYATLQAAIDAAQDDDVITFLCDVTQADGVVITDKKLKIDLNGKTFTVSNGANTNNRNFKIDGASEVVILNGTMVAAGDYSSGAYGTVRTEGTAKVELQNLKLYNYRGNGLNVKVLGGTTVTMTDVEIYSQYGGGVESAGGTVELTDVVVQQKGMYTAPYNSMAISVNGGGKVTVQSGTYSTECLTAEEANNQGTSHGPWVAGVLNSGGTLIINGGTFSNDNFGENSLATYARGAILADTGANIQINGGTFNALKAIVDIQNNLGDASKNPTGEIKGGIFSADPSNDYVKVAEGYIVTENNGTYTVAKPAIAKIGDTPYATLQEALNAAQAGDTIELLADVTATEVILLDKNLTINGNGHKVTSSATRVFRITTGNIEVAFDDVDIVSTALRSANVDSIRGISIDGGFTGIKLTLDDCSVDFTDASASDCSYAVNVTGGSGHTLTVNGGTYEGANVINVWGTDHAIAITGATLTSIYGYNASYYGCIVRVEAQIAALTLKNNTFNGEHAVVMSYDEGTTITTLIDENNIDNTRVMLGGSGTEADPYLIKSLAGLKSFRDSVNAGETKYNAPGVYVALGADIDLAGVDWSVNIGDDCSVTFDGIFDGQGHTIKNLTSTETAQKADGYICTGLFGAIYGSAQVKNLTLENVDITAEYVGNNVAALVGFAYNCTGTIDNVTVKNVKINATNATGVGAIVGYDYYSPALKVTNCTVDGTSIAGAAYVGGVVGYASTKIQLNNNTVKNLTLSGTASVGGVAGIMLAGGSASGNTINAVNLSATGAMWANSVGAVAGTMTNGSITVADTTVTGGNVSDIVGGILVEKPTTPIEKVQAKIGNTYYTTFERAADAAMEGQEVTLLVPPTANEGVEITAGQLTGVAAYEAATLLGGTFKKTAEGTLHYEYAFGVSNVIYKGGDDFTLTIAIEDADSTEDRTLTGRTLLIDMKVDGAVVDTFTVPNPVFVAVNDQVTCDVDVELSTLTLGNGEGKATYFEVKVSDAAVVAP